MVIRALGAVEWPVPVTVSMGVSAWSGATDAVGDLVRRADAALYLAKAEGRDAPFPSRRVASRADVHHPEKSPVEPA